MFPLLSFMLAHICASAYRFWICENDITTALYCFPADFLDLESLVLSSPSGAVEKYFDNLVTMIEDAAEGL